MLQVSERRRAMIMHLTSRLPAQGYQAGKMPEETSFTAGDLEEIDAFAVREKLSDFRGISGYMLGESNAGQFIGNLDDDDLRLERLRALAKVGILPDVSPIRGGLYGSVDRALGSMSNSNQDLDRIFNELIIQGVTALDEVRAATVVAENPFAGTAPEKASAAHQDILAIARGFEEGLARRAGDDGLIITREVAPADLDALSDLDDVRRLLLETDINVGLSPVQTGMVSGSGKGFQGVARAGFMMRNQQAAFDRLAQAGLVPELDQAPREKPTGNLITRLVRGVGDAFSSVSPDKYQGEMIHAARRLLRHRLEELVVEPSVDVEIDGLDQDPAPA